MIYLIIAFISLGLFSLWQHFPSFNCPDTFYHAKMAELISRQGIVRDFPWQQFTVLKDYYIDHHFLFHLILIPFTKIFSPLWGTKIAGIIFAVLFILVFYWLLRQLKIKYAPFFGLLLLFIPTFVGRLNLAKASAYSLIVLWLGLYAILTKKKILLFALSFIYVWLYDGWPLLLIFILIYYGINFKNYKKNSALLFSSLAGFLSGIIINPYFPTNLVFYKFHIINIGLINYQDKFAVGAEWYPYSLSDLISQNNLAFLVLLLGLTALALALVQKKIKSWGHLPYLFSLTLIFFFLTLRSVRFIEYFIPLTILTSAFCLNYYPDWLLKTKILLRKTKYKILAVYLISVVVYTLIHNSYLIYQEFSLDQTGSFDYFQAGADWLKNNTSPGQTVFNASWDEWPYLFYHNTQNNYLVGLDPTFMYNYDAAKFDLYQRIIDGQVKTDLCQTIYQQFQAPYVIIGSDRQLLFLARLKQSSDCQLKYQDDEAYIFSLTDF